MGNSEARRKLREEDHVMKRAERLRTLSDWKFDVKTEPPSLKVSIKDETHLLSERELKEVMRGYLKGEYFEAVITDEETGEKIHVMHLIDLSRYSWLPKYVYVKFIKVVCEAVGLIYRPQMLDAVALPPLTAKARVEFREKLPWDKAEKRAGELGERITAIKDEISSLEKFFKEVKKK